VLTVRNHADEMIDYAIFVESLDQFEVVNARDLK